MAQLDDRAVEWLADDLGRGEKIKAVAAGSYPDLVRGRSIWVVAIAGAILGTLLEGFGLLPPPFGLAVSLLVAIGGWYVWLLRRPASPEQPAAPWPLVVVTNQRVLFLKRGLIGGDGEMAFARKRSELKRAVLEFHKRNTYRMALSFADGPDVRLELHRAKDVSDELVR
ncbi:MAG TPA: hypothetical protein VLG28_12735 [Acidimicrobiia bacterium]|jgi:hypothetical protein|nr:hypothetical protein [Acidimicrobiia bacterium]